MYHVTIYHNFLVYLTFISHTLLGHLIVSSSFNTPQSILFRFPSYRPASACSLVPYSIRLGYINNNKNENKTIVRISGTYGHFVAIERLRVLRHLYERPDGIAARAGHTGLDQKPDKVVVEFGRGQQDADPRGGDILGRDDLVGSGRGLSRLAVARNHCSASERRSAGSVSLGRLPGASQQGGDQQDGRGDRRVTSGSCHLEGR